ncbi:MAG: isocitrate lyase/phosphoenolpyruvate mutase family protein, partial [Candidatus Rokuibacteriota bacterium]
VVPGAVDVRPATRDMRVLAWLRTAHGTSQWTTSVCTGAIILGHAGVLQGLEATTHWAALAQLRKVGAEPLPERSRPGAKGTSMRTTTRLRQMLQAPGIIAAPGAYDGFSAHLIEAAGFPAVYMTGAGTAASHLGMPDLGLATLTEMANHARHLATAISVPLIADADTGYGNALNVVRTVREYERAGAAALHLEDQVAPKKCGHIAGKQVIAAREFAEKIRAAAEHRSDPDFVIIARTDARAVTSLDDAIERGNLYREAGADLIFVEAPQTDDEIRRVAREVKAPLLSNMVQGGKTPSMKFSELERLGYKVVIYPALCMVAAIQAMEVALGRLKERETDWHDGAMLSPLDVLRKVGFDHWSGIEQKYRA